MPDRDGISPEVLKLCEIDIVIINFANNILINNEKPTPLGESDMVPVPKKGDLSLPSNRRGISISSTATKVINQVILNRIQPKVDPYFRPNQNCTYHTRSEAEKSQSNTSFHRFQENL